MRQCPNDYHDSNDLYHKHLINMIYYLFYSLESYAQFVIERSNISIGWPINNLYDNVFVGMQLILVIFDVDRFNVFIKVSNISFREI